MTDPTTRPGTMDMQEGDRFVCSNCGCEIELTHHGDPEKMRHMQAFVCCCGTRMESTRPA